MQNVICLTLNFIVFAAMQSSYSNKEDAKRRHEHIDHITEEENKEQFRRRQPHTKPANP